MTDQNFSDLVVISNTLRASTNSHLDKICDGYTEYVLGYAFAHNHISLLIQLITSFTADTPISTADHIVDQILKKYENVAFNVSDNDVAIPFTLQPCSEISRLKAETRTWREVLNYCTSLTGSALLAANDTFSEPYIELVKFDMLVVLYHNSESSLLYEECDFLTAYVIAYAVACGRIGMIHILIKTLLDFPGHNLASIIQEIMRTEKNKAVRNDGELLIPHRILPLDKILAYAKDKSFSKPWLKLLEHFVRLSARVITAVNHKLS